MNGKVNRLIIVAPYSPPKKDALVSLAASKKIELVIGICDSIFDEIVLVDSSHSETGFKKSHVSEMVINGVRLDVYHPFTLPWRKLGKLLNLIYCYTSPVLKINDGYLWVYNPYLFEVLFAHSYSKKKGLVLEIEDMPMSRKRTFFNLKNRLDNICMKSILSKVDLFTYVNKDIEEKVSYYAKGKGFLFPSVLSKEVINIKNPKVPFEGGSKVIGYFGGLSIDKGTDLLIELINSVSSEWSIIITGCGPMERDVEVASFGKSNVTFHGVVDNKDLYRLMDSVDVLLNPHAPISDMGNGVFPFKVCEYIALEKMVLSTKLPKVHELIDESYFEFEANINSLTKSLDSIAYSYPKFIPVIKSASAYVRKTYSEEGVATSLKESIYSNVIK